MFALQIENPELETIFVEKFNSDKKKFIDFISTTIAQSKNEQNQTWEYWNDTEIDNFGKIAIGLSNNDYDNEDYSKW